MPHHRTTRLAIDYQQALHAGLTGILAPWVSGRGRGLAPYARPAYRLNMMWRRLVIKARSATYGFRESLFVLPLLIVLGGVVTAELAGAMDQAGITESAPFMFTMSSNAAIWLLSIVGGATITTAGVVFSLTVVSLQLASSQFSPRVMRSFVRDRLSQSVVGVLIATFVYCVLVLRNINGPPQDPAPRLSLTLAVVLTMLTVVLIIAHLNHLAHRLQVGEVVRAISGEGAQVVQTILSRSATETAAEECSAPEGSGHTVYARCDGWVSQAHSRDILSAVPAGTTVRLDTRTGAYIHEGEALLTLWPSPARPQAVARRLKRMVQISDTRTMQDDVDFAFRQLADVGLRALSAAINDPNTAVEVVLRIGSLLRRLLSSDLPPQAVSGPGGRLLLRPWELDRTEYIAHAFDQLRHAAPRQPQVAAAMIRTLQMLIDFAGERGHEELLDPLNDQIRMLMDGLETVPELNEDDLRRLKDIAFNKTDPAEHTTRPTPKSPAAL